MKKIVSKYSQHYYYEALVYIPCKPLSNLN